MWKQRVLSSESSHHKKRRRNVFPPVFYQMETSKSQSPSSTSSFVDVTRTYIPLTTSSYTMSWLKKNINLKKNIINKKKLIKLTKKNVPLLYGTTLYHILVISLVLIPFSFPLSLHSRICHSLHSLLVNFFDLCLSCLITGLVLDLHRIRKTYIQDSKTSLTSCYIRRSRTWLSSF
jgi:hypothetical protein